MDNKIYNWRVKRGNINILKNANTIRIELNGDNGASCLLEPSDTEEVIEILTNLAQQIWENPDYVKTSYSDRLFTTLENEYFWDIESSQLQIRYNRNEEAIEMKSIENKILNLEVNQVVEIVQILKHLQDTV